MWTPATARRFKCGLRRWAPATASRIKCDEFHRGRHLALRFKRGNDRLFGALAIHFLVLVRQELGQPPPRSSTGLILRDVAGWATTRAEVEDTGDQKDIVLLGRTLLNVAANRLPQLANAVAMRIREIRTATRDSGSWERAGVVSLLPGPSAGDAPVADGASTL